jgi:FtsH-binding integral membrane protein
VSQWAADPASMSGRPTATQDGATLFAQTMGYVAITVGFFALGAYLGRHLTYGWGWVAFIAAFICLFAMRFAARQSGSLAAFQRLRRGGNAASAPLIAASIFLDALNVFLFFLNIFSRE